MRKIFLILFVLLIICNRDAYAFWGSSLYGKVEGNTYISSPKNFKVPIPVEKQWGGSIQDGPSAVIFTDDFGTLYRIECIAAEENKLQKLGKENYLQAVLKEFYLPQTILYYSPNAEIIEEHYSPDLFNGTYFCTVNIPKGSITASSRNGKNYERNDSRRGLALFINKNKIFIVSSDLPDTLSIESKEEEIAEINDRLIRFSKTIIFN